MSVSNQFGHNQFSVFREEKPFVSVFGSSEKHSGLEILTVSVKFNDLPLS